MEGGATLVQNPTGDETILNDTFTPAAGSIFRSCGAKHKQSHNSFFEKSDLFFVCMLRPLSSDIKTQRLEILNAQWMPFEEYAAQPFIQKSELLKYINDTCLAKMGGQYSGFSSVPTSSNFSDQKNYLYLSAGALKSSYSS
ncbi:Nudix hydrolase 2 [Glycine max]|nr:Nudix hydrolase 2 [Glycine max]